MKKGILIIAFLLVISPIIKGQWIQQYTGNPSILFTTNFIDENNGFAAGDNEAFLRTTNGGTDWEVLHQGGSTDFHADIFFIDSQTGWSVLGGWSPFRHGYILKTTNGGETWVTQLYLDGFLFISVFFIDDQRGWAVGTNGIIFITTNGGSTWNFQYQLSTGEWLYDVFFINQNNGWAVGNLGNKILRTTNGGNSWELNWIPSSDWLFDMEIIDQNNGITVGDNGRILTSKDGGNSWDIAQSGISNLFRDVEFSSSNEAWAVGYGGVILYTTDIGDTWHTHQSGTTTDLFSASFINELKGWVCGDDQLILHNTSGVPVELVNFTATWQENQILLSWITASETNNFGFEIERKISNEWEVLGFVEGAGTTTEMNYYSFIDNIAELNFADKLFYRLKQLDLDGTFNYSQEVEVMLTQLTEYSLHQNFPNPFNPSTTVSFDLPVNSNVILTILNSIGEQVTKLADGECTAGTHQVIFNASNLSSGLYIYRIQAVGEDGNVWMDNKKMILIK
ncbi:MAG: hypothetical protein DRQ13_04200 [Ignavibacteriae bacterium]|nr:MAG: hypothetical protein DRQ13_04200 [Ignavibacteriota bacterium]